MDLRATLADQRLKAKEKVKAIAVMLLEGSLAVGDLIRVAKGSDGKGKGTCIEAIEFATGAKPHVGSASCLDFVTESLLDDAPRVKWESAKVVANIAHLHPRRLDDTVRNLLANREHPGTVVRWSVVRAMGEIANLRTGHDRVLIPALESILSRDNENAAIVKVCRRALKQAKD